MTSILCSFVLLRRLNKTSNEFTIHLIDHTSSCEILPRQRTRWDGKAIVGLKELIYGFGLKESRALLPIDVPMSRIPICRWIRCSCSRNGRFCHAKRFIALAKKHIGIPSHLIRTKADLQSPLDPFRHIMSLFTVSIIAFAAPIQGWCAKSFQRPCIHDCPSRRYLTERFVPSMITVLSTMFPCIATLWI